MKRWTCAVAIFLLAGCSAVPSFPGHQQMQGAVIKASGGAFNASYSGNFSLRGCPGGQFNISGSGSGSFIHGSSEKGYMSTNPNGCGWNGYVTLTNALHPRNTIIVNLALINFPFQSPCSPRFATEVHFVVSSGTGKFAHATGSGKVVFTCHSNGTYTDQWSGTITF